MRAPLRWLLLLLAPLWLPAGCHLVAGFSSDDAVIAPDGRADARGPVADVRAPLPDVLIDGAAVDAIVVSPPDAAADTRDASADATPDTTRDAAIADANPCPLSWIKTLAQLGSFEAVIAGQSIDHFVAAGQASGLSLLQRYDFCGNAQAPRLRAPPQYVGAIARHIVVDPSGTYCIVGQATTSALAYAGYAACWGISNGALSTVPTFERADSTANDMHDSRVTGGNVFIAAEANNGNGVLVATQIASASTYAVSVNGKLARAATALGVIATQLWVAGETLGGVYMARYSPFCQGAATCARQDYLTYSQAMSPRRSWRARVTCTSSAPASSAGALRSCPSPSSSPPAPARRSTSTPAKARPCMGSSSTPICSSLARSRSAASSGRRCSPPTPAARTSPCAPGRSRASCAV